MSATSSPKPAEQTVSVSAVVPCRNEIHHIEACLRSLLAQESPPGGFEIIIADGMSNDGTRDVLERMEAEDRGQRSEGRGQRTEDGGQKTEDRGRWAVGSGQTEEGGQYKSESGKQKAENGGQPPSTIYHLPSTTISLRVVDNPLGITPCGMNCGIRAARGRWIAIMGSHNRYAPDYLVRCLEVAQATGADNIGGAMVCEGESLLQKAIAAAHHSPFAVGGARWHNPEYEGPADTVFGGFYRREIFDKIGLFDEGFVRNQDDELNLRLTRAGGKIWHSPSIKSWYRPRESLGALFKQYMQYGYWKVRVIQKHKLPASWRHLVPGAFVFTLLLLLLASILCLLTSSLSPLAPASPSTLHRPLSSVFCLLPSVLLASLLTFYGLCVLGASLLTARKTAWKLLPVLPLVFPCYHLGYGWGFLRGVWDFVIRRKAPKQSFQTLTR